MLASVPGHMQGMVSKLHGMDELVTDIRPLCAIIQIQNIIC